MPHAALRKTRHRGVASPDTGRGEEKDPGSLDFARDDTMREPFVFRSPQLTNVSRETFSSKLQQDSAFSDHFSEN